MNNYFLVLKNWRYLLRSLLYSLSVFFVFYFLTIAVLPYLNYEYFSAFNIIQYILFISITLSLLHNADIKKEENLLNHSFITFFWICIIKVSLFVFLSILIYFIVGLLVFFLLGAGVYGSNMIVAFAVSSLVMILLFSILLIRMSMSLWVAHNQTGGWSAIITSVRIVKEKKLFFKFLPSFLVPLGILMSPVLSIIMYTNFRLWLILSIFALAFFHELTRVHYSKLLGNNIH